jgi:REP element-mobilizing transposase RayT
VKRQAIGEAFAEVVRRCKYTVWACAILSNHAHLCVRRHRDDALTMWNHFAEESRKRLRLFADIPENHPIWSHRPYKVFLYTPEQVRGRVQYVEENPAKHGIAPQTWPFVQLYDGWPLRR